MTLVLESLSHIADGLPKGRVLLDFEKTDMKKAKEFVGDKVCIYGNVPAAKMVYGSPEEMDAYCKQLIEDCGEGGGHWWAGAHTKLKGDDEKIEFVIHIAFSVVDNKIVYETLIYDYLPIYLAEQRVQKKSN